MTNITDVVTWTSPLSVARLQKRAELLASLRHFFAMRQVLEVEVPLMGRRTVTDPYIQAISCKNMQQSYFLQTSPEYFMKRLLAGGAPSMYYLGKAFREDESGRYHNPEFTMLEWYRLGFDDLQLMAELDALLRYLRPDLEPQKVSYAELFYRQFALDPHSASAQELALVAQKRIDLNADSFDHTDKSVWLDLLFSHFIEPSLIAPTIVYDYPACQCALAKVMADDHGREVAKRFELFWQGIELANAYWELADAQIQRERFEKDQQRRQLAGLKHVEIDEKFLAAMDSGLPECAGIALGVDRLFMCMANISSIDEAISFADVNL